MTQSLHDIAQDISAQAEMVYQESITSWETMKRFQDSVPVTYKELYQRAVMLEDTFHQAMSAAWHARYAAEKLLEDMNKEV